MSEKQYNDNWSLLHENGYFKNHRLYNDFKIMKPHNISVVDIKDGFVLDIGCGYGRNMGWFCDHASFVAGIDVAPNILAQANTFLKGKGNYGLYTVDNYKEAITVKFDYIFSRYVFQHISKEQTRDYIHWIKNNLEYCGQINLQFRVGSFTGFIDGVEPRTEFTMDEIEELLEDFEIDKISFNEQKDNVYILGTLL